MQKITLINGIRAEREAIAYYTHLKTLTDDGQFLASIEHMLNEEKDHKKILEKRLRKLINEERKLKRLDTY